MDTLHQHGPRLIMELLSPDMARRISCEALVDTGADLTSVEEEALSALGHRPYREIEIQGATGVETRGLYRIRVRVPNGPNDHYETEIHVAGLGPIGTGSMPFGLIGRNLIGQGELIYNRPPGQFSLTFEPGPARVHMVHAPRVIADPRPLLCREFGQPLLPSRPLHPSAQLRWK